MVKFKTGDLVRVKGEGVTTGRFIQNWSNGRSTIKILGRVRSIPHKNLRKPYSKRMLNFVVWWKTHIYVEK